MSKRQVTNEKD